MKPIVICIVGASGSGKTTASLIFQKDFGWNTVVSYTTRPIREGETDGLEHWFVSADKVPSQEKMCAYTRFGGYEYWATWGQLLSLLPTVYVIDEKGVVDLLSKESAPFTFHLVTIKIKRKDLSAIDDKRKDRDKDRMSIPEEVYDYVIDNNGSLEDLTASLYNIAKDIIKNQ